MSLFEGSRTLQCGRHNFTATNIEEWNDHCDDGDHLDEGTTICPGCGAGILFSIPFVRFKADGSKGINTMSPAQGGVVVLCEDCREKQTRNVVTRKLSKGTDGGGQVT